MTMIMEIKINSKKTKRYVIYVGKWEGILMDLIVKLFLKKKKKKSDILLIY